LKLANALITLSFSPIRLNTPRYLQWDLPGRCTRCHSSIVEIDYVIQPNGVSVFCSRLSAGEHWIAFDKPMEFDENATVRLKARNKVLNLQLRDVPKHPSPNAVYVNGQLVNGIDKENIDPEPTEEKIDEDGTQV
jgi:hypothetical protein